jgi:hypothetical protein
MLGVAVGATETGVRVVGETDVGEAVTGEVVGAIETGVRVVGETVVGAVVMGVAVGVLEVGVAVVGELVIGEKVTGLLVGALEIGASVAGELVIGLAVGDRLGANVGDNEEGVISAQHIVGKRRFLGEQRPRTSTARDPDTISRPLHWSPSTSAVPVQSGTESDIHSMSPMSS